ncbi:BTB/POZ domain-containing protein 6-A-like [Paramacrobiotus metropolitanus]|uniref:BTB/POZ domain-containing protein 6-A-like n=1 Tax=Paramacrobiotus metropolitanus TaxID=2943436 RepID=UPI00244651D2|nr:BTB/POZ domain-containing protein 6-A-like [Paramacrobiotus metropolitanus]
MYTDKVENLNTDNVILTMNCADKYDFAPLVRVCLEMIHSQLSAANCLPVLEQALHWHAGAVAEKCFSLLDKESSAVLKSKEFTAISQGTLQVILQRNTLSVVEHAIYLAVERWATEACRRNDLEPSAVHRRQMLGDALYLVRFPLLSGAELADGPAKSGLLTESELLNIFLYQNAAVKPSLPFPTECRENQNGLVSTDFQVGDEVFVKRVISRTCYGNGEILSTAYGWKSAVITGMRQSKLAFTWRKSGREGIAAPKDVIRVEDVTISDESLQENKRFKGYKPGKGMYFYVYNEDND